jgi:DNA (cytosine-5)-methyltransferase 1
LHELIVDSFAGGGGGSTGIEMATGRPVDIAINHDPVAILMHKTNHPCTEHLCENVWDVNPRKACKGRPVGMAWFSPDCKHFSKAKGGTPLDKHIRGLAWLAVYWAAAVHPRVIMLENVEEFQAWGPLTPDGHPDINQKGRTFRSFLYALSQQGYEIDHWELRASDYGAPTSRKRFFLVARCDGQKIIRPVTTHGNPDGLEVRSGLLKPWRTAAEIIDWSISCPSIFERSRPLAENTLKRIARGIQKFVIEDPEPFIANYKFDNEPESINRPLSTITAVNGHYVVAPILTQYHSYDTDGARGQKLDQPLLTVDTSNRYALTCAFLSKYFAGGYNGAGADLNVPTPTVTAIDHNALVTSHLIQLNHNCIGQPVDEPLRTITSGAGHFGEVRAFLVKYYGGDGNGQSLNRPLDTVTSHDRFGLVMIHGTPYQIVDIGMRMLTPRELFDAQGFPHDYIIDHDYTGRIYPKNAQVARCGNAVCPPMAAALVKANMPEMCERSEYSENVL